MCISMISTNVFIVILRQVDLIQKFQIDGCIKLNNIHLQSYPKDMKPKKHQLY